MDVEHHEHARRTQRLRWVWWLLAAGGAFYLIAEHRAHASGLIGLLPFLILAACPLLHMSGHGGHGGHRSGNDGKFHRAPPRAPAQTAPQPAAAEPPTRHVHGGDLP